MMIDDFQKCFEQLYAFWQKCVAAEGQYFGGDCVCGLLTAARFEIWLLFWNFLKLSHMFILGHLIYETEVHTSNFLIN
jgi:hypothetical protein